MKKTSQGNEAAKALTVESVGNGEDGGKDNPEGEVSEVAKGKRREVIAPVEIKTEPAIPTLVSTFCYYPSALN